MGDHPRRRQHRSCGQCRTGKRQCDVDLNPQRRPTGLRDESAATATHSSCTNSVRWKKQCTVDWLRSLEKHGRPGRTKKRYGAAIETTMLQSEFRGTIPSDPTPFSFDMNTISSDPTPFSLDTDTISSDPTPFSLDTDTISSDPASFSSATSTISSSVHSGFCEQQWETIDTVEALFYGWSSDPTCQSFSDALCSSLSSRVGVVTNDKSEDLQPRRSERGLDEPAPSTERAAHRAYLTGKQQKGSPQKRSNLAWSRRPNKPNSLYSSHCLAEDQHRLDIRKGLLNIYHNFLETSTSCWTVERKCPLASCSILDPRDEWRSNCSDRIVTRVCKLDNSPSMASLLSADDRKHATKSLTLAIMTQAAQWAHLNNGHGKVASQPAHGLGVFERNMQGSLWQQASLALGRTVDSLPFKAIYASMSAAINYRSFVLEDADVDIIYKELNDLFVSARSDSLSKGWHQVAGSSGPVKSYSPQHLQIWGNYFLTLQTRVGDVCSQKIRWPWADVEAASCLVNAAPVEILFFHRGGQLQNLCSRRLSSRASCPIAPPSCATTRQLHSGGTTTYSSSHLDSWRRDRVDM